MAWCEQHAVDYVLGLAKNTRLTALIADELAAVETESVAASTPVRRFADLTYETLDSWSRSRRVVAKEEYLPTAGASGEGKANPRFVVTSLPIAAVETRALYEDRYCARGEMENRISAATMRANQLRLYYSSLAYVLLHALRRLGLVGTDLARAQCQTIRLTLLKIGARLRVTVRNVWLALATG